MELQPIFLEYDVKEFGSMNESFFSTEITPVFIGEHRESLCDYNCIFPLAACNNKLRRNSIRFAIKKKNLHYFNATVNKVLLSALQIKLIIMKTLFVLFTLFMNVSFSACTKETTEDTIKETYPFQFKGLLKKQEITTY